MFSKSDCEEPMYFFGLGYLITSLLIDNKQVKNCGLSIEDTAVSKNL